MDNTLLAGIIGASATLVSTILILIIPKILDKFASLRNPFQDILGLWKCDWFFSDAGVEKLFDSDTVNSTAYLYRPLPSDSDLYPSP